MKLSAFSGQLLVFCFRFSVFGFRFSVFILVTILNIFSGSQAEHRNENRVLVLEVE